MVIHKEEIRPSLRLPEKQNPFKYANKTYSQNGCTGDNFGTERGRKIVIAIMRDKKTNKQKIIQYTKCIQPATLKTSVLV